MRKYVLGLVLLLTLLFTPASVIAQSDSKSISTAGADCSVSTRCAIFGVQGSPSIGIYLNVATSGTFNFEATTGEDPSTATWFGITDDIGGASNATVDGALFFTNPGYTYVRLRASAISGTATAVAARGFGGLRSTATLAGAAQGDGAIQDGSNNLIEATVADLTNSNPLAAMIVDSNGDQITSFGGGTQYAVDAALGAAPTGTLAIAIRDDTLAALTPIEGDAVGLRVSSTGALWVASDSLSTAANQTTIIGHVDGIEALLTSMDSDTSRLTSSASAVDASGTLATTMFMTGAVATNAAPSIVEGRHAALSMDLSGALRVSGGGGGTQYAEDSIHASGDTMTLAGVLQQTADSALAADGDRTLLQVDANGYLKVNIKAGAGSGGTALADDGDFTAGTTSMTPVGGFYQSAVTACTDGDACAARMTAQRALAVTLYNEAGTALSLGSDYTHNAALTADSTAGPAVIAIAKDQDGAALPNAVSAEGDAVLLAASLSGVQYVMLTNEDGSAVGSVSSVEAAGALLTAAQNADTDLTTIAGHLTASTQHYRTSAGATEDEFEVKATAGVLTGGIITNTAATVSYLKCSNLTAANTTPGTSAVFFAAAIPGATTGAGFTLPIPPGGITFSTALTCYLVKGAADTDVAEVGANEVKVNLFYR